MTIDRDAAIDAILADYPPVMTVEEVSAVLRIQPAYLRKLLREGGFPAFKVTSVADGKSWRILRSDVASVMTSTYTDVAESG